MKQYLDLLRDVLDGGDKKDDRTGTGVISVFGRQMRFDLSEGFPLLTTKRIYTTGMIDELLWFIAGSTNINDLPDRSRHWWSPWADGDGNLGPTYGKQLRYSSCADSGGNNYYIDQLSLAIETIKTNPSSRRIIINLWHTPDMLLTKLPCCHGSIIQFNVTNGRLSCQMYQRSADVFIGLPINIASYSLLIHMIAEQCDLDVGDFIWTGGDVHLYLNHIEQAKLQLTREPYPLPTLNIKRKLESIFDYKYEDFELVNYQAHPHIKGEVSI